MNRHAIMLTIQFVTAGTFALPAVSFEANDTTVTRIGFANCEGPIATASRPIRAPKNDPEFLLRMKRSGRLPDQFTCGRCTYNLAGDLAPPITW